MYNLTVHSQQVLGATICAVSLSETNEDGVTYTVATAMSSSNLLSGVDEDPLYIFLEQIKDCLSRALGSETGLWFQHIESDGMDGGWRGAGNPDSPSEART